MGPDKGGSPGGKLGGEIDVADDILAAALRADTVIRFDAANGSTLKGTVRAEGLSAGDITLVGPDGGIPFAGAVKNGKAKFPPTLLTAGTGTYEIRIAGSGPATYKLTCTRPKKDRKSVV